MNRVRISSLAARGIVLALTTTGLAACVTQSPLAVPQGPPLTSIVEAGLNLYEAGDYVLAARRFSEAGERARALRSFEWHKQAVTAECVSWLQARRAAELSECTLRLEQLQKRGQRSEPGVNTLIALGAVAGQRPLPAFKVPNSVQPLLRASAREGER